MEETLAILRDANAVNCLAASGAERAHGESVSAEELTELMRHVPDHLPDRR